MDNQTQIDILKDYINLRYLHNSSSLLKTTETYDKAQIWLQELEQSNNKDNIDNWTNKELFDYCVENELISYNKNDFEQWDAKLQRNLLIDIINTFKSQK